MTYGVMQSRIADETQRADLASEIQNAILDAIALYERQRFYFNEIRDGQNIIQAEDATSLDVSAGGVLNTSNSFVTVQGQEFYGAADYALIGSMASFDKLVLLAFANVRYTLVPRTPQWVDDMAVSTTWQGIPTDFTWVASTLRLYPIPDNAYPIFITGTGRFTPPSLTTDTSPWFEDAERLIRCTAKRMLYAEVIRDMAMAAVEQRNEAEALSALRRETAHKGAPARLRTRNWF